MAFSKCNSGRQIYLSRRSHFHTFLQYRIGGEMTVIDTETSDKSLQEVCLMPGRKLAEPRAIHAIESC